MKLIVAAVAEQGLAGFETGSFQGVVGPADMPRDSVSRRLAGGARTMVRAEQARWAKVVKESGAKFD
jgi:hypothetical protein